MNESIALVQLPEPSASTIALLGVALLAIVAVVVGSEIRRRRHGNRIRLESEWRTVANIFKERQLTRPQQRLLQDIIRKFSPGEPLAVVTTREGFESCIDRTMASSAQKQDDAEFRKLGQALRDARMDLGLDYVPLGQSIHSTRELHQGQYLSLSLGARGADTWHRMMVESVDESYYYLSSRPDGNTPPPSLRPGATARAQLWRDEDARYAFPVEIDGPERGGNEWRAKHTGELRRTQARAHFRVRYDQPTNVGVLSLAPGDSDADLHKRRPVTRLRGRITSLSAGGCAVVVNQPVTKHVALRVDLEIGREGEMSLEARIIASTPISGGRYLLRCTFAGLTESQHDIIARYVLRRQRAKIRQSESPA